MASPSIGPLPSPAYSTDEDHFSDAHEDIKDEEFEEAPSTPIRTAIPEINEDGLATPKNVSPVAEKSLAKAELTPAHMSQTKILLEEDILQGETSDTETSSENKQSTVVVGGVITGPFDDGAKVYDAITRRPREGELELLNSSLISLTIPGGPQGDREQIDEKDDQKLSISVAPIPGESQIGGGESPRDNVGPKPSQPQFDYDENEDGEKVEVREINIEAHRGDDGFGDDFGDDFDNFGEVIEGEDFDDFDGFEEADAGEKNGFDGAPEQALIQPTLPPPPIVPVIDLDQFQNARDTLEATSGIISKLYSSPNSPEETFAPKKLTRSHTSPNPPNTMFLTERSESLWHQLVAPPPLQPPDWKRSRIRRLFLVSLGVPVDLDEILPASKQKKLVLPSTHSSRRNSTSSPSRSGGRTQSRSRGLVRGSGERGTPSSSRAPSSHPSGGRRTDKSAPAPDFDMPSARIFCSTSDVALSNFAPQELREHIARLQDLTSEASEVLTYWLKKRDGAMGDKETFETVIESLVGYARKTRQSIR